MEIKQIKALVKSTGAPVKVVIERNVNTLNIYRNIKTGDYYHDTELIFNKSKNMWQLGFHLWRFGAFIYFREYIKYRVFYLIPGVCIGSVDGHDRYVDIEIKFLCFAIGIKFIWIKKK